MNGFITAFSDRITLFGDERARLEGCDGIVDVRSECIKVSCSKRIVGIFGSELTVLSLSDGEITVNGKIKSIEYLT